MENIKMYNKNTEQQERDRKDEKEVLDFFKKLFDNEMKVEEVFEKAFKDHFWDVLY